MGWSKLTPVFEQIPSGIKTRYEKEIASLVSSELLKISQPPIPNDSAFRRAVNDELEKYSSSRAFVSDLAGTGAALAIGWLVLGDSGLGLLGMSDKLARKVAHQRESSNFFLGEGVGSVVFDIFPPAPTQGEVVTITLVLGVFLTLVTLIVSVASDPLRNQLGLHERKLESLLTALEDRLVLARHRAA